MTYLSLSQSIDSYSDLALDLEFLEQVAKLPSEQARTESWGTIEKVDQVVSDEWNSLFTMPTAPVVVEDPAPSQNIVIESNGFPSNGFQCPLSTCQRFYRRKGDLKTHFKKKHIDYEDYHTLLQTISPDRSSRDKPFPCLDPSCKSGFQRKTDRVRHVKTKHPRLYKLL